MHSYRSWILPITVLLALASCVSPKRPAYQEQGWASYVADHYAGRPTASGQIYYPQAYTAAHTSLPFGTVLTVKNVMNGRSVDVTVNDRFPYYPGRVVNLSSAAAQQIGIPYLQMGQVQVTAASVPQPAYAPAGGGYGQPATAPSPYGGGGYPGTAPGSYGVQPAAPGYGGSYGAPAQAGYPPAGYGTSGAYTPQSPPASYTAPPPSAPGYGGQNVTPPGLKTF